MYKKSLFFNGKAVYDYVYNNTKVKNIVFGYFLSPSEKFYGQLNDAEINVYYSDITLNCFNPKITIKKDEKDNTVINVHYNSFHYFLIYRYPASLFPLDKMYTRFVAYITPLQSSLTTKM